MPAKTLLILIHADPSVRAKYARDDLDVVAFVGPGVPGVPGGGLSSRYDALAASCNQPGGLVRALAKRYPPPRPLESYERVFIATWSAGYAFLRHLTDADRDLVAGIILLDSGHTDLDPDKTASDKGVQWCVKWAMAARANEKTCWIGHTDVDPVSYASTTKFAREVVKFAGEPTERFFVRAFNTSANPKVEHVNALNQWGPDFVHDAIDVSAPAADAVLAVVKSAESFAAGVKELVELVPQWFGDDGTPKVRALGHTVIALPEAVVDRARVDVGRVVETSTNNSTEIAAYLARVGSTAPNNWCAAAASSWYLDACAMVGAKPLVKGSAGAKAFMGQWQAAGRFVSAADARKDPSKVAPGDFVFWHRGAPGAWTGHVGIVSAPILGGRLETIEANSGPSANETSDKMARFLSDPLLLGFGKTA